MKKFLAYVFFGAVAVLAVGCTISPETQAAIAEVVVASVRPSLAQIEGLSAAQVEAIIAAIRDGVSGGLSVKGGEFDWGYVGGQAVTALLAALGVNMHRNAARKRRSEPV